MFKSNLIFIISTMVAEWQLVVVKADIQAERAVAYSTARDRDIWMAEINVPEEDLEKLCSDFIIEYEGMESFVDYVDTYPENVTSMYVENVRKRVMIMDCYTTDNITYVFTGGKNRSIVALQSIRVNDSTTFVPQMLLPKDYRKWDYIHGLNGPQGNRMAVCEKIFIEHHPQQRYQVVKALRALRNGIDENFSSRTFMTLLCYYDWDQYFEYCEGDNDFEVFQVLYSGGGEYMPMRTLPIQVDYQF